MLDIQKEKAFIQEVDKKTRDLELEKAKLEQNKTIIEEQLNQIIQKMESLGCTPDNIDLKIQENESKIQALKTKMENILNPNQSEDIFDI